MLREQAREETKMQKWFNNFNPQQARFHKELVRKIVQDTQDKTEVILDSCYIGAILQHTEMELSECIKIAKLANTNMEETSKYLREEKEYYNMINDEKLRGKIREEAKELQTQGMKIAAGIKELRKVYNFPQKDIHIIWAEGREELKAEKEVIEETEEPIKIKGKITNVKKTEEEIPYAVTEKEIEGNKNTIVHEVESQGTKSKIEFKDNGDIKLTVETKSKLKILEQTIKGEFGTYVKSAEGVKLGIGLEDKLYKDISEVKEERDKTNVEIKEKKEYLYAQLDVIKNKISNLEKFEESENSWLEEIEAVFNM